MAPNPRFATGENLVARPEQVWDETLKTMVDDPEDLKRSSAERMARRFWPHGKARIFVPGKSKAMKAYAVVNQGRWIIRCPVCPGAQYALPSDQKFFCVDCFHEGSKAEGAFIQVVWPTAEQVEQIEAALMIRPVENQNWEPGESLAGLEHENAMNLGGRP